MWDMGMQLCAARFTLSRVRWCPRRLYQPRQAADCNLCLRLTPSQTRRCFLPCISTSAVPPHCPEVGTVCIVKTVVVATTSTTATVAAPFIMAFILSVAGWVLAGLALVGVLALAAFLSPELRALPAAWMEKHLFPDANQITPQQMAQERDQSKVYRILAFGDSLTEGFTQGGSAYHPYAKKLGDHVYQQLPNGWHLEVEEQGESGERVLFGMRDRLQRTLDEHTTANRLYDWVLLLAGINDLAGDNSTADEVMAGLDNLVQASLQHGANVLLFTVMEVADPVDTVEQQRQQLNRVIAEYVQQRKWDLQAPVDANQQQQQQRHFRRSKPEVFLFDLASALPFEGMDEQQRWEVWDDGVHLTMAGYEHMGTLITEALVPLIQHEMQRLAAMQTDTEPVLTDEAKKCR